jgi:hypothetical protein
MMEMVLALFAVVFFTSLAANYNRILIEQNDYLINAAQHVQATHLCHGVLDEVDAKLFAKKITYNQIINYDSTTRIIDLNFPGDRYELELSAAYCDSVGNVLAEDDVLSMYRKITVEASTPGLKYPVQMQRIYAKIHYYN